MFWGFSEALDLVAEYNRHVLQQQHKEDKSPPPELNILLFGAGDPRHILCTLAAAQIRPDDAEPSTPQQPLINIYLLDGCLEIVARNILLLNLALEPPGAALSLKSRAHIFLDLYGNALLRPASHAYLCSKARLYADCITDLGGRAAETLPLIDFGALKYGERDTLAGIFEFWRRRSVALADLAQSWERRVRADQGQRYDHRAGAFDWDLQMRLRDNGVARVCTQEYRHWRDTGVAFAWPEYEQTVPNRTLLAAGVQAVGRGFRHRGYVGDIWTGPFVTFGEKCVDGRLLRSEHGTNAYRATDIAERNVLGWLYEIAERKRYVHDVRRTREIGGSVLVLGKHFSAAEAERMSMGDGDGLVASSSASRVEDAAAAAAAFREYHQPATGDGVARRVRVRLLSLDEVRNVAQRERFANHFDVVFVGQNYHPFLDAENFAGMLRRGAGALVVFETKQNLVLRKREVDEFLGQVKEFARKQGLRAVTKFGLNGPVPLVRYVTREEDGERVEKEEGVDVGVERVEVVDALEEGDGELLKQGDS